MDFAYPNPDFVCIFLLSMADGKCEQTVPFKSSAYIFITDYSVLHFEKNWKVEAEENDGIFRISSYLCGR